MLSGTVHRSETTIEQTESDYPNYIATSNVILVEIVIQEQNTTRKLKDISVDFPYPFTE